MKNRKNKNPKIEGITYQKRHEAGKTGLSGEPDLNAKIVVKSYLEPARPYFSSPCMLSEIESNEDFSQQ